MRGSLPVQAGSAAAGAHSSFVKALVLFGSPGSGKGTQARMLTQCLGIPHISTGDLLRQGIRQGSYHGTAVEAKMHSGVLVSDAVVNRIVEERLSQPDAGKGFILDGYPRTLDQANHLNAWLDGRGVSEVVIHLAVDYNIIIARLTGRRQCPRCGTLYNVRLAGRSVHTADGSTVHLDPLPLLQDESGWKVAVPPGARAVVHS